MGRIGKGILGGFSGTVGAVIGATWKGIAYIRSKPAGKPNRSSPRQLDQQARFRAAMKFLQPLGDLPQTSFRDYAVRMTGFNNAMSYTLNNAITGTYPHYQVEYSLALVSRGDLPNVLAPNVAVAGSMVTYNWTPNQGTGRAAATDRALLVLYCPSQQQCIYTTLGAERSTGTASINAAPFAGQVVHTYIAFIAADDKNLSNSYYTGQLAIPA